LRQHKRSKEVELLDPEFMGALYEDDSRNRSSHRQAQRKAQQFCRQVQRALNLALADGHEIDEVSGLFVEDVSGVFWCTY
jgi:hypothetical protein